jgi:hypothetical protein
MTDPIDSSLLGSDADRASANRHPGIAGMLRQARWGAADHDQVLATAERIQPGDPDSWALEWIWTAGQAWARGNDSAATAAGTAYLHAATYYGAALSQVAWSSERDRWHALWRRHRECWDLAVVHQPIGGRRLELPYLGGSLPAYFFPAQGAGGRRPLVIVHNGASAPTSAMWGLGGKQASNRGYHWLTFDGPGQQSAFYDRGLAFRPDWEAVLTPVLDAVTVLPEVDPLRIAAIGVGQAGYWLPRALLHEHRLAATVVQPGVVDVVTAWEQGFGDERIALHRAGDLLAFDRALHAELVFAPKRALQLQAWAAPYGHSHQPLSSLLTVLSRYRLPGDLQALRTPLLIVEPYGLTPWPGQSRELQARLPIATSIVNEPDPQRASQRTFDWLASIVGE